MPSPHDATEQSSSSVVSPPSASTYVAGGEGAFGVVASWFFYAQAQHSFVEARKLLTEGGQPGNEQLPNLESEGLFFTSSFRSDHSCLGVIFKMQNKQFEASAIFHRTCANPTMFF
jgi:hypothetical protein